jgi:predicted CxxxxCH...CXXCH cytochrome family protein
MAPAIGAHQAHVHGTGSNSYSRELTCYECHNSGTTTTFANHMNGNTQNVVFTNASTASDNAVTATWTAGTYPNGTCSLYCHGVSMPKGDTSGTARTPAWTANLMTGVKTNDCSLCHGNPPTTGTTAATHVGKAPTTSCAGCHNHFNATGGFDTEANRRLHINGVVNASGGHNFPYGGSLHLTTAGTTPWADCNGCHSTTATGVTYAIWAASGTTATRLAPNCTTCHTGGLKVASGTSSCWDCHGASATDGRPTGTVFPDIVGSHNATGHVSLACAACHTSAGAGTTTHGNSNAVAKVRTDVIVAFPAAAGSWASGTLTCSATYCHSTVQNVTGTAAGVSDTTPAWGSGTANCATNCHGNTTARLTTGKHTIHLAATHATYTCDNCHTGFGSGTATHANSIVNVQQSAILGSTGTYTDSASAPANSVFGNCAASYCHSSVQSATGGTLPTYRTVAWSGAALTCAGCHGNSAATLTTGSHAIHLTAGSACTACHGTAGGAGNTAVHANQAIDVDVTVGGGASATYSGDSIPQNSNFGSCSATTCHGSGASPVWGANTANAACTKCHGTPSTSATNANMAPAIGAHQAHVHGTGSNSYSRELTCYECHNSGTTTTFANHMNGNTQNVVFTNASTASDNAVTATWTAGTYPNGTCSLYCHGVSMPKGDTSGTARTPAWTANLMTGVKTNDCSLCHGNPPTTGTTAATHVGKAPTTSCAGCHNHFNATGGFDTEANRRLHIDGIVQAAGDCNSCHAYDTTGTAWNAAAGRYDGGAWGTAPGAHVQHINFIKARLGGNTNTYALNAVGQTYGVGVPKQVCGTCHSNNEAADHNNGVRNINFGGGPTYEMGSGHANAKSLLYVTGTNPTYSAVNRTCSNLSCHYFTTPAWF